MAKLFQKRNALCSIYKLTNKENGKIYIGRTWYCPRKRFQAYRFDNCAHLSNAVKKYGLSGFYHEILTVCATQDIADYWEKYFISHLDATNRDIGYNLREGGNGGGRFTEETKHKMSLSAKRRVIEKPLSDAARAIISATHKGAKNYGNIYKGKTWRVINGKRIWMEK